jgi:microcystin degradation protein MlrC
LRVPFLLSLNVQSTMLEPAASVFRILAELDASQDVVLSFAMGFPAADIAECGPMVWGYGERAKTAVNALHREIVERRAQWRLDILEPLPAVQLALQLAEDTDRPVVIADTQDNPGAGGDSNTTGMLHALLAAQAGRRFPGQVAFGLLFDPAGAQAAHAAGLGAELRMEVGAQVPTWGGRMSDPPVRGVFRVRALSDGDVLLKGPMFRNSRIALGPSACVDIEGIQVIVVSGKSQLLDRELYRFVGIEPECMKVLVNKSSVHFRADFTPIASSILVAKAAGPVAAVPAELPWTKLPPGMAPAP